MGHEKGIPDMATFTAKEIAAKFETDARTLRKFLRSDARAQGTETPGKGHRYAIEARQVRSLQKRFNDWVKVQEVAETDE